MKKTLFILSLCTLFASCSCNDRTKAQMPTDSSGTCTIDQQSEDNNDNQ